MNRMWDALAPRYSGPIVYAVKQIVLPAINKAIVALESLGPNLPVQLAPKFTKCVVDLFTRCGPPRKLSNAAQGVPFLMVSIEHLSLSLFSVLLRKLFFFVLFGNIHTYMFRSTRMQNCDLDWRRVSTHNAKRSAMRRAAHFCVHLIDSWTDKISRLTRSHTACSTLL